MMNWSRILKDMSFRNKLRLSYVLIIMIPVLALGGFIYYSSVVYVRTQQKEEISNTTERIAIQIENYLKNCEDSSRYIVSNHELQTFLKSDDKNAEESLMNSENIGAFLYSVLLSNQYYIKIEIFTPKNFMVVSDLVKNDKQVQDELWYQETLEKGTCEWWYNEEGLFITRSILSNSYPAKSIGILRIKIKEEMMQDVFKSAGDIPLNVQLKDGKNAMIEYQSRNERSDGYFKKDVPIFIPDWYLSYEVDSSYFQTWQNSSMTVPLVLILAVLVLVFILINILSKSLLRRLYFLVHTMNQVKEGDMNVKIEDDSKDELGMLASSAHSMLMRINTLINKVYVAEIEQKTLELNLLQAKISPHFLYNNLSSINWIALKNDQDKIHKITTQMATFYRTALNKGKSVDMLRIEVANIKAYLQLQLISHNNSFDVKYDISDELLNQHILTFILQPLVENAIEHGIDLLRDTRGLILIKVYECNGKLYLQVKDNGSELYKKYGKTVIPESVYGYGTGNVNKRIQLFYGSEYGCRIYSDATGTTSELCLRLDTKL